MLRMRSYLIRSQLNWGVRGLHTSAIGTVTSNRHDRLCERCGLRPAVRHELAVFGPVDLRETHLCLICQDAVDAATELAGGEPEGSFAHFGPVDFDVLRSSIRRAEADPHTERAALQFVAGEIPRIAIAHGQALPSDIHDFVVRYSE
jgi:hypothetical protein